MRRKNKKTIVDFRIKPEAIFIGLFVIIFFSIVNPSPAEITFNNAYQKLTHFLFPQKSEYLTDAYINDVLAQDGRYNLGLLTAVFENNPLPKVSQLPTSSALATVLPAQTSRDSDLKWIEVDLSDQTLIAWENGEKKYEFIISSGKPWTPTVIGEYQIWIKLRFANMKGGSKEMGDYYFLPNVPFVMYFYKGYGLHGTYWHNNFGTPMSHGCVNMKTEDAEKIFEWVGPDMQGKSVIQATPDNPGTKVVVHS